MIHIILIILNNFPDKNLKPFSYDIFINLKERLILKNKRKLLLLIISWGIILGILYSTGILTTDIDTIKNIIQEDSIKIQILFVFLSTIRIMFFIPQTIFILIGSVVFGPYVGFILSFISLLLSQSIMYLLGKYFNNILFKTNFSKKQNNMLEVLKTYGYKFLALGIICPVAPSDLIIASAALIKLDYKKCISIIALADAPMIFLYGFLGTGFENSHFFKVLTLIIIVFISYYSFLTWNKVTKLGD